jgi:hypothetical protein
MIHASSLEKIRFGFGQLAVGLCVESQLNPGRGEPGIQGYGRPQLFG